MTTAAPLIHTTLGNVPVDSLVYETTWEITPTYIKFVEKYTDKLSEEVVRQNAHVYSMSGVMGDAVTGEI